MKLFMMKLFGGYLSYIDNYWKDNKMTKTNLRPLQIEDLDNIMSWINDPEVTGNFNQLNIVIPREEEKRYLEDLFASESDFVFAIEDENRNYIGNIGLHEIDTSNYSARFAIIVGNKDYWGRGYGENAINSLLERAFEEYGFHKIWGICLESNKKAQHLYLDKCGFQKEGVLRDHYNLGGKLHDMVQFSMLWGDYYNIQTIEEFGRKAA